MIRLSELAVGQSAKVTALHLTGPERRRILDLGFAPGVEIRTVRKAPLGDPIAYEVRGATVALRKVQSDQIEVSLC